jgi:hypothetical protein
VKRLLRKTNLGLAAGAFCLIAAVLTGIYDDPFPHAKPAAVVQQDDSSSWSVTPHDLRITAPDPTEDAGAVHQPGPGIDSPQDLATTKKVLVDYHDWVLTICPPGSETCTPHWELDSTQHASGQVEPGAMWQAPAVHWSIPRGEVHAYDAEISFDPSTTAIPEGTSFSSPEGTTFGFPSDADCTKADDAACRVQSVLDGRVGVRVR